MRTIAYHFIGALLVLSSCGAPREKDIRELPADGRKKLERYISAEIKEYRKALESAIKDLEKRQGKLGDAAEGASQSLQQDLQSSKVMVASQLETYRARLRELELYERNMNNMNREMHESYRAEVEQFFQYNDRVMAWFRNEFKDK